MLYQILPTKEYQFDAEKMNLFLKVLSSSMKIKQSFMKRLFQDYELSYIIDCDEKEKISFYFEIRNERNQESVKNALQVLVGDKAHIFESSSPLDSYTAVDTLYLPEGRDVQGKGEHKNKLLTYYNDSIFSNIIGMLQKRTRLVLDFKVLGNAKQEAQSKFRPSNDVEIEFLLRVYGHTKYARTIIGDIAHKIASLTGASQRFYVDYKDSYKDSRLSSSELMNLLQLPTLKGKSDVEINKIYHLLRGQVTLKEHEFSSGIRFGCNYHPFQLNRIVKVSYDQMRKHGVISGTTGSGKSSVAEEAFKQIIKDKLDGKKGVPGFTFLDPLESSALGVIDIIMKFKSDGYDVSELMKQVHYIDFSTDEYIFPISLLNKKMDPTEIIEFLESIYGDQSAYQVNRMMTSAIQALLRDPYNEHTIFDVERIFDSSDSSYRDKLLESIKSNVYAQDEVSFLKKTKFNQAIVEPIKNRLTPFKNTEKNKLMFSMGSKYDRLKEIRKWMDEGDIVLFNLKGISKFDIRVIAGYTTVQYYTQAMQRPDFSLLHLLVVDELHDIQLPIFPKIGAKSRKGGLSFLGMTQFLEQLTSDYREQLLGNLNTFVSMKQKSAGAQTLSKMIPSQDVTTTDLISVPSMIGYLSTEEGNKERSIVIQVEPPYRYTDGKKVDHLKPEEVQENIKKNRVIANELMARECMSKSQAEQIVFADHFSKVENEEYEKELLAEGDSLLSVEEGGSIWEEE